jgi:gamma-glutamyl-gamma-aminobutyrate hydrolase PuuD
MKIYVVGGSTFYANWIKNYKLVTSPKEADILFFTGGEDVNPQFYNENVGKHTYVNELRDEYERDIWNAYLEKPKICVCRGSQFASVMSGGKLIQHVTNHSGEHKITTDEGNTYNISSTHHQMVYPFDIDHKMIAWSTNIRSNTYLNGDNKEIQLPDNFVEPEIVFYPKTKALGIQGHPEMYNYENNPELLDYLNTLIEKYLINV